MQCLECCRNGCHLAGDHILMLPTLGACAFFLLYYRISAVSCGATRPKQPVSALITPKRFIRRNCTAAKPRAFILIHNTFSACIPVYPPCANGPQQRGGGGGGGGCCRCCMQAEVASLCNRHVCLDAIGVDWRFAGAVPSNAVRKTKQ